MAGIVERKVGGTVIDVRRERAGGLQAALEGAQRGDRVVYHVGHCCGGPHRLAALSASVEGKCFLFCKRVGDGVFAYLAVRR